MNSTSSSTVPVVGKVVVAASEVGRAISTKEENSAASRAEKVVSARSLWITVTRTRRRDQDRDSAYKSKDVFCVCRV